MMKCATVGVLLICAGAALAHQEAAPAPSGNGPGEVVARLPWGTGPQAVGGELQAEGQKEVVERVPSAFFADETGAVHILDAPNRRILLLKPGAPPATVSLAALGSTALAVDFVPRGKGWLVADQDAKAVVEIGPDGAAGARWTGFSRVHRLELAGDQVLARDEVALSVSRLDAGGKVESVSPSPHANPVLSGGAPVLARVVAGRAAFTLGRDTYSLTAHRDGDEVQGVEVVGADAKGAVTLAVHEGLGDDRRGVWLARVAPGGEVEAEVLVPPVDDRFATIPRFFRTQADGKVLSFRTSDAAYELSRVTLAPPASGRKAANAGSAQTAEESARAALCRGDAAAARAAVAGAALAAAFDEPVSARLDRDLAALEAGAAPAQLCALAQGQAALDSGDAAKALKSVASVDDASVADRRLWIEGTALEKTGDLREALRRWQNIVLQHADSPYFAEANANVLRIIDSGKLQGAQPK